MVNRVWCTEGAFCRGCPWHKYVLQILPKAQLVPDFLLWQRDAVPSHGAWQRLHLHLTAEKHLRHLINQKHM